MAAQSMIPAIRKSCPGTLLLEVMGSFHFEGQLLRGSGKFDLNNCYENGSMDIPMLAILSPFLGRIIISFGQDT